MLTGRLVRVRYARQRIIPSYVDASAPEWQEVAERMLELFRGQEGQPRGAIEADVRDTFGSDPQQLVHQGLAKLLEDRCDFEVVADQPPEKLRERAFRAAARHRSANAVHAKTAEVPRHFDREAVLREVADEMGLAPEAVDRGLFADLKSEQRLIRFQDLSPERLLQRYNVGLAQAVLLRSTGVKVFIRNEPPRRYRQLMRAVKFHRLIAEAHRTGPDCYVLQLDGPLSLFSATSRYGLQLALFLPVVLHCRDFALEADLKWGPERKPKTFTLSSGDGLVSYLPDHGTYVPPEVGMFVELFRKKSRGWEIAEEAEVLPLGDGFWVPDYRLVHTASQRSVFLEVLGFWRRSSAEKHLARLREHANAPFVLAVSDQLHIEDDALTDFPAGIHRFRQMPVPDEVVRLAEAALGVTPDHSARANRSSSR